MLGGEKKTTNSTLHTLHYIHFLISRFTSEKLQKYPPVLSRHPAIFPLISFTGQPWSADPLPASSSIPPSRPGAPAWVSGRLANIIHTQNHTAAGCAAVPRPASHRRSHRWLIPCFGAQQQQQRPPRARSAARVCCCDFSVHEGAMPAVQCAGAIRSAKMEHLRLRKGSCITFN